MGSEHSGRWGVTRSCLAACVAAVVIGGIGGGGLAPFIGSAEEGADPEIRFAAPGTPFRFEVIESHDAEYLGDTPAHLGRSGGLTIRPRVALGDPVYRTDAGTHRRVGHVTHVVWNRVSGSLQVEFDPAPLERVAVGDEVWIDLNPEVGR